MAEPLHPLLVDARAITLKNPWAHLIAHHGKNVENRKWMPPEHVDALLIHAGKAWDEVGWQRLARADLTAVQPSAVVAVARVARTCATSRWIDGIDCSCGEWAMPGQCHWRLTWINPLPDPVPCVGRQGLWRPPAGVLAAVSAQIGARHG
jgi:hypothetical protein